jgi:DNA polymerase phi
MSSGSVALQLFWDLSSSSADSRHAAALQLTKALRLAQKTADTAGDAPADEKAAALRADGGVLGSEVTYSVRRLIKGLASSREGSREGFALGLCLLLRSFSDIDCGRLLQTMMELLPVKGGGLSDTEIKENNFGRLFGCMALIQTGKCTPSASEWSAAVKANTVEELPCVKVLDELARLQGSKSFMAEATTHTASQMMSVALAEAPADVLADILLPRLRKGSEGLDVAEMTPEQLQLHLFSQNLILPGKPACLKETEIGKLVEPLKKATCSHPRLHQVWTQLLEIVATFQGAKSKADRVGERWGPASLEVLKSMWLQVVEDALMVSSHERKYAALLLVQQLVPQLPPHAITMLLSPNMRRTLCNNLGKKQCLLYKAAHTTLEALMSRATSEPSFALALLQLLVKEQRNFDKVTHTRTTSQLLECLDEKGKMEYLTLLLSAYRSLSTSLPLSPLFLTASRHAERRLVRACSSSALTRPRVSSRVWYVLARHNDAHGVC